MIRSRWIVVTLAVLIIGNAKAQAPADEFGFLEKWQTLSNDFRLGKVPLTDQGLPQGYDTETAKSTEGGHFQVAVRPEAEPPPFNQIHTWLITIESPDGAPVSGAALEIYGGMPLHNHAFATTPKITGEVDEGIYALEGVKFNMFGWWTLAMGIKANGKTDKVSFNLILDP